MEIILRNLKNVTSGLRGAVNTKFVYTVPVNEVDRDFLRNWKNVSSGLRGMVYTKCVYIVPVTAVDGYFP